MIPVYVLHPNKDRKHIRKSKLDKEVFCESQKLLLYLILWNMCVWLLSTFLKTGDSQKLDKNMIDENWILVRIPCFPEYRLVSPQTPYLMKSLVFLSFFSIPIPCLKHVSQLFWNLVTWQPLVREFHHPPNLIPSRLTQLLIWIQDSLHNLVFGILINRTKMSPKTWCHMDSKKGIEIEKILLIPLPNDCFPSLESFSCWNHLCCQM